MGILPARDLLISAAERAALARAIEGASRLVGATAPNPPVGCVLLDADGAVLAEGYHLKAGAPHAEAAAIAEARMRNVEDLIHTVVVTLEPCNHHGRTPPCAEAILKTPARRVVIAAADPNPSVRGGGAALLAEAGLDIVWPEQSRNAADTRLALSARRLIAPFSKLVLTGRPWVTLKQAVDEGGRMIPPPGQKTFTSEASLRLAHQFRRRADAILTGSGTVLADDPAFTVRLVADFPGKKRFLVLLDRRKRVPERYVEEATQRGFDVFRAVNLDDALDRLGAEGVLEVLVEAGPAITRAMFGAGLVDEHVLITKGEPDRVRISHAIPEFDALNGAGEQPGERQ
ncbi:bifunctional diaminohydroxyphosphoribosylaminopyrimidine deaminase/5-amino-6-(5-phosphoribosylamino)uracil reductase RibD [Martelella endophytica]|uniref:Riboflavin biosynthesis protein RibD n=1 Tax=Martelella endophytica TaxID=1486262 RepID=A0A0D5LU18_MAREN|nr:bifunctional diaminohydroxyphosphoribosylaminopyrimidine deaminase/5-amino-6-(5-phosphoribosylamino)uracil reductase RibD [Martelella endophytica]AJY47556.1 riboflavin biosynthesis protein RibD [Martelella endophytica]